MISNQIVNNRRSVSRNRKDQVEEEERRNIVARTVTHSWSPDGEVPDAEVVSALHVSGFHFYRTVCHHISLLFTPVKVALGLHKGNEAVFFFFFTLAFPYPATPVFIFSTEPFFKV